ncbi:hypothetical protein ILYODFUR_037934 [Ilyodon furcidens]|uniref:Uncharacterized protein n=1 Tax=Ilyodon furcidens TaxID=33524 RepID=A0ABV0TQ83_9TELE
MLQRRNNKNILLCEKLAEKCPKRQNNSKCLKGGFTKYRLMMAAYKCTTHLLAKHRLLFGKEIKNISHFPSTSQYSLLCLTVIKSQSNVMRFFHTHGVIVRLVGVCCVVFPFLQV